MLTPQQIEHFPVAHLSPSAIRQYLGDRQGFFKRYIRLEFDERRSPAAVEGTCAHAIVADYWTAHSEGKAKAFDWERAIHGRINHFFSPENQEYGLINWGKTGSEEASRKKVEKMIGFYIEELPNYTPITVEQTLISDFEDMKNNTQPIAIKCVTDLVNSLGKKKIGIVDHKFTSRIKEQNEVAPAYEIQACANFFVVRKHFGVNPESMVFDQIKTSQNKDGSPQRVRYEIVFTPKILNRFIVLYQRIVAELSGMPLIDEDTGTLAFLPNPDAQFGAEESWLDFCEEVDNQKQWTMADIRRVRNNRYSAEGAEALDL